MTGYLLTAETSVHVGDGLAVGVVDLPVARESLTGWPMVPGSATKGALRARSSWLGSDGLDEAFGTADRQGTLRVPDALLVGLPVRVASGGAVLLSCPLALARLQRELGGPDVPEPGPEDAWSRDGLAFGAPRQDRQYRTVWLEELDLVHRAEPRVTAWAERLATAIGAGGLGDRLVVVDDALFGYAARSWTELRHRNAIDDDGVVRDGQLFTVECCAPGTVWWLADGLDPRWLPTGEETMAIGGHHTVGAGRVRFNRWEVG